MTIQDLINTVITKHIYKTKEEMTAKLDVFLLVGRITTEDYKKFVDMLED